MCPHSDKFHIDLVIHGRLCLWMKANTNIAKNKCIVNRNALIFCINNIA